MMELWPRLPLGTADAILRSIEQGGDTTPEFDHEKCYYAPLGKRTTATRRAALRDEIYQIAKEFGFPGVTHVSMLAEYDLRITRMLHDAMPMAWSEAGSREVWSFVALVLLPDVTKWRWQHRLDVINDERWVCSDMTRHTWARLWWRHVQVEGEYGVLSRIGESGLNQFFERRDTIGANPPLIRGLAKQLDPLLDGKDDRDLIRDVARRILRQMAFIDEVALTNIELDEWIAEIVSTSVSAQLAQPTRR
ncbi:hypothetical protein ACFQ6H_25620 [Rhodococcus sp. NPDC056506]|uniref:hypothetical protein n=1 Tax=Rhodococcus sp. NPDC056506 TaxID=3345844 RepID=UPI00366BA97C